LFGGPTPLVAGSEDATNFRDGNIIMGGDGNDTLRGNGGFDLLDGDAYLNVRIGIFRSGAAPTQYYSAESLNTDSQAGPNAGLVYRMVGNGIRTARSTSAAPAFARPLAQLPAARPDHQPGADEHRPRNQI
jgi:hypothetical protein